MQAATKENVEQVLERVSRQFEQAELFYGHGTDNPWDEAVYLVFSALGIPFDCDDNMLQKTLSEDERTRVNALVRERIESRRPVAYLVREAWFAGLPFAVDERVLIPRSPLAELILNEFDPLLERPPARVLDLCTGSGCIGIATALAFPDAEVDLADISAEALILARENIGRHGLEGRVSVHQSDLFASLDGPYDLILCNPPYVSQEEIDELPEEYRHEPALGLHSEDNGLAIPLQILRDAPRYLSEDGLLIMEVGYSHEALAERLPGVPFLWLEFAHGGEGIFALTARQLRDALPLLA
ncbi:MAG: 50S ribosomal protein L3 N(5)-glutamine methyltransferase [Pseudomonadales bacterium]|nr:50S ribosomal protein L3 N(5)-glutamine methyltransferase [Pseudomonadales bacterium]